MLGTAGASYMFMQEMKKELKLEKEAEANLSDMKIRKSEGDKAFTEYKNQLSLAKSDADKMQSEYTDAKSANEEALKKLDEAKKLLYEVKMKKADWDRKIADLGGLDTIKQELVNLAAQKATNAATIQQRDATISLNLQKKQDQEAAILALRKKDLMQKMGLVASTWSGTISSVDTTGGFYVINKGNSSGVVKNAKLDVLRGADKVGTLVVTNVQPSTSVCDLVPGTLTQGAALQPGDRLVVNEESTEKKLPNIEIGGAAAAPAAEGAAPAPDAAPAGAPADPFGGAATAPASDPAPAPATPVEAGTPAAPAAPAAPAPDPFAPAPAAPQ
jgi:archaellum component FlaG (FlaF/FlaG flagellin family)